MLVDDYLASWPTQRGRMSLIHWFPTGVDNRAACGNQWIVEDGQVESAAMLVSWRMCLTCRRHLVLVIAGCRSEPTPPLFKHELL